MRDVYPGFLQLHGFVSMNLDRHIEAHRQLFHIWSKATVTRREAQRILRRVSRGHGSRGRVLSADRRHGVRAPRAAERRDDASRPAGRSDARSSASALLTVEGEHDDISGVGQTEAAHRCASTFPAERRRIGCSPASDITACSTVRASAPKSRRASPISCCRWVIGARLGAMGLAGSQGGNGSADGVPRTWQPAGCNRGLCGGQERPATALICRLSAKTDHLPRVRR